MVNATVTELQRKNDAAGEALGRTLESFAAGLPGAKYTTSTTGATR
jgi:hypothetical protein